MDLTGADVEFAPTEGHDASESLLYPLQREHDQTKLDSLQPDVPRFVHSSEFPVPVETLFAFHEQPDAFKRLTPPWAPVRVLSATGGIQPGARVELEIAVGPLRIPWVAEHTEYVRDALFTDVQKNGPFRHWVHRHRFERLSVHESRLTDEIDFSLPGGALTDRALGWLVRGELRRMFRYRHRATLEAVLSA